MSFQSNELCIILVSVQADSTPATEQAEAEVLKVAIIRSLQLYVADLKACTQDLTEYGINCVIHVPLLEVC